MTFDDQVIWLELGGRRLHAIVTGDALHMMWGEGVGPQTAEGLVAEHVGMLEQVAAMLIVEGRTEPDGSLVIDQDAIEGDDGDDWVGVPATRH